jgi:orotidine-5'-phosphate decarboxylase
LNAAEIEEVWAKELRSMREEVARLAALAAAAELHGIVVSPLEAEAMKRRHGPGFLIVTPGIRPSGDAPGDQVRVATPAEAVRAGADFLVVGRPVLAAAQPREAVAAILAEMLEGETAQ